MYASDHALNQNTHKIVSNEVHVALSSSLGILVPRIGGKRNKKDPENCETSTPNISIYDNSMFFLPALQSTAVHPETHRNLK